MICRIFILGRPTGGSVDPAAEVGGASGREARLKESRPVRRLL